MNLNVFQFLLYIVFFPCITSSIITYLVIKFSRKHNLYDATGGRKIHTGFVPRLGGIGFVSTYLLFFIIFYFRETNFKISQPNLIYIIVCLFLIFIMGLLDDLKPWKAMYKFLIQCVAAIIVLYAGFRFKGLGISALNFYIHFNYLGYIITFLWIIGITNAINLMDGIDGQAGCLSISILLTYSIIFYAKGFSIQVIYTCLALVFAIVGFLFFNLARPRAKIFMGDCGSQFLGFIIAVLPLIKQPSNLGIVPLPFATILLILPIFDTFAAIWRRIREKRSIGSGDKFHIHHKLMLLGFSAREALLVYMLIQIGINIFVTVGIIKSGFTAVFIVCGLFAFGLAFFFVLHYKKEKIVAKSKEI